MRNLVPIKVKIGLHTANNTDAGGAHKAGHAKFPDFNSMQIVKESGLDWSIYVDIMGLQWHYDKCCGHKEEDGSSPHGMQWGMLIVPKEFSDQAIATFPDEISKLTEAELEDFYDNRAHAHEPDNKVNTKALEEFDVQIRSGKTLTVKDKARHDKAMDPNDDTPGVTKNKKKNWVDFKKLVGVEIVQ